MTGSDRDATGKDCWEDRLVRSARHYVPRSWRADTSETIHQAQRYSLFVKVMKRALPLAALALALAVLAYALQPRDVARMAVTFERLGKIENDLAMVHPRLTGVDDTGLPFVVTAASAVQDSKSPETVSLNGVNADMTLKDGTAMHLTAAKGVVDTKTHRLDVSGGIRFSSMNGYSAETQSASADLKSGIVHGETPITAESKFGNLRAQSFSFDKDTRKLLFHGEVHMLLSGMTTQ